MYHCLPKQGVQEISKGGLAEGEAVQELPENLVWTVSNVMEESFIYFKEMLLIESIEF